MMCRLLPWDSSNRKDEQPLAGFYFVFSLRVKGVQATRLTYRYPHKSKAFSSYMGSENGYIYNLLEPYKCRQKKYKDILRVFPNVNSVHTLANATFFLHTLRSHLTLNR